jgi:hypothetical protein
LFLEVKAVVVATDRRHLGITGNPNYQSPPFTAFSSVTPQTPLGSLNLDWREKDLPEWQRTKHVHRLHPYLGKFVPQLVEIFLRKYRPKAVCDPFCGSGTTLVEANTLGIHSVGCDISAFNCLLSRVKTAEYDLQLLDREIKDVLTRVQLEVRPTLFRNGHDSLQVDNEYLRTWFAPEALSQLLFYRSLIPEYEYQDVLKIILSRSARSARLTTHFDLDFPKKPQTEPYYCRKHRRTCQPTRDALKFLTRYSLDTLRRIREFSKLRTNARVGIVWTDAREAEFPQVDAVITSPPYVGLIDYHDQHRYAYELLGLPSSEDKEIGPASNGNGRSAVQSYVGAMVSAFSNVKRSVRKGGPIVVVVHDRRDLYEEIGAMLGMETEHRFERHVNRRTGRRAADFFEDVIIWRAE